LKQKRSKAKRRTVAGIMFVCAGFVLCFAGVFTAAAAKKVTGVAVGIIVVGAIALLAGFVIAIAAGRSGPVVSVDGMILDRATNHHYRGTSEIYQDFYLVQDASTHQKYPVYVDRKATFSTLSFRPRKFVHQQFEVGDQVIITGRMQPTISDSEAGRRILGGSDMESTEAGPVAWAEFIVPQTMDRKSRG